MSPQKWDVWLVITAQGWGVPGESTEVVLLPLPVPFCLSASFLPPTPSPTAVSPTMQPYLVPTHPTSLPLTLCATSNSLHNLSSWPHTTLVTAAPSAASFTWLPQTHTRRSVNLINTQITLMHKHKHRHLLMHTYLLSIGAIFITVIKIRPSCNFDPLIIRRL